MLQWWDSPKELSLFRFDWAGWMWTIELSRWEQTGFGLRKRSARWSSFVWMQLRQKLLKK